MRKLGFCNFRVYLNLLFKEYLYGRKQITIDCWHRLGTEEISIESGSIFKYVRY